MNAKKIDQIASSDLQIDDILKLLRLAREGLIEGFEAAFGPKDGAILTEKASGADILVDTIRQYRVAWRDFCGLSDEVADKITDHPHSALFDSLVAWEGPAPTLRGAIEAIKFALEVSAAGETPVTASMMYAALEYFHAQGIADCLPRMPVEGSGYYELLIDIGGAPQRTLCHVEATYDKEIEESVYWVAIVWSGHHLAPRLRMTPDTIHVVKKLEAPLSPSAV